MGSGRDAGSAEDASINASSPAVESHAPHGTPPGLSRERVEAPLCATTCPTIPPARPIGRDHQLFYALHHAWHQCGCGADKLRISRHNSIAAAIADLLVAEGPFAAELTRGLASSTIRNSKVDLVLTGDHLAIATHAFDVTVSCSLTPSHLAAAVRDAIAIFRQRDNEKREKHLAGSIALGRAYHSVVFTTLGGIGPDQTVEWFDAVFLRSAQREVAAGGRGRPAATRRLVFYATLQAALIKATARMLHLRVGGGPEARTAAAATAAPPAPTPQPTASDPASTRVADRAGQPTHN